MSWYKEGLRFKCTGCGKCCTGAPGYVWITEEEIMIMAEFLKTTVDIFKKTYVRKVGARLSLNEKANYDCIFLKDKKCQIYEARPKQCRTFPWWQQNLESAETWKRTSLECEGINDSAPLFTQNQIAELFKT